MLDKYNHPPIKRWDIDIIKVFVVIMKYRLTNIVYWYYSKSICYSEIVSRPTGIDTHIRKSLKELSFLIMAQSSQDILSYH
jgi:hypothetical protein